MNQYSDLKILQHSDRIDVLRRGGQIAPVHLQLSLSDACNHACPGFCAFRMIGYPTNEIFDPSKMIPTAKCEEIIDDAAYLGVKAIQFGGGGEPTVHPQYVPLMRRALDHGLEVALCTNGNRLGVGWEDVYPRLSWVRVSVDAGTPETYATVRGTKAKNWQLMLDNLHKVASLPNAPYLTVSYVVMKSNVNECALAAIAAKDAGAKGIRFAALFSNEGAAYYDGWWEQAKEAVEHCKFLAGPDFEVIDMLGTRREDLVHGSPTYKQCFYQEFTLYIGGDMNLYRCCDTAYSARGLVGSVKDQSLLSYWHSPEKLQAYANFDARGCQVCKYNGKNELVNAAVAKSLHANFV